MWAENERQNNGRSIIRTRRDAAERRLTEGSHRRGDKEEVYATATKSVQQPNRFLLLNLAYASYVEPLWDHFLIH